MNVTKEEMRNSFCDCLCDQGGQPLAVCAYMDRSGMFMTTTEAEEEAPAPEPEPVKQETK